MSFRGKVLASALTTLCCLLAPVGVAQTLPAQDLQSASVVLRLQAGKTTYRLGEEIPLELEFRGKGDQDFYFSTENYDRSGRLTTENYEITPQQGFVDPLSDLFADGFIAGGLRTSQPLNDTPFILHVSLNDWARFQQPGIYRVVVTSARLHRRSNQPAPQLTSNSIEFTIAERDDAWAASQIKTATDLIDKGGTENLKRGAALLRYLDTEAAVATLLDRFDKIAPTNAWDAQAALVASSHRARIISQMEMRLDEGGALDSNYLPTLTRLRVLFELSAAPASASARRDRMPIIQAEYDARWRVALTKRPATAVTLAAELTRLPGASPEVQQQIAQDLNRNPVTAAEAFAALPGDSQWLLLREKTLWTYLNRPWIVPALRKVYDQWKGSPSVAWPAGDLALTRLYELEPVEARRLILDEIRTGDHQIGYDALALLPEAELPELDTPLQTRHLSRRDGLTGTAAWLMARYGSSNLLPFVSTTLSSGGLICTVQGGLLAYLFKKDSETALKYVAPNRPRLPGCVAPLTAVAAHYWDEHVESAAIEQLNDSNVRDVVDAAQLLTAHGSAAAKQPLLARLMKWSEEWQGRAAELAGQRPGESPQGIENFIVNALFQNRQFAITRAEALNIRTLCVTDQCRNNIDGMMSGRFSITITETNPAAPK